MPGLSGQYGSGRCCQRECQQQPRFRCWTYELDYMPRDNVRFALQYVDYSKFNGGAQLDGLGRNANDNNTLYLYGWFMF